MAGSSLVGTGSGGIHKLNGIQAIGQEVTLTSTDGSVVITPDVPTKSIDLSTAASGTNFSYSKIATATTITIPVNQQMSVYQDIEIEGTGDLIVDGEFVIYE